MKGGIADRAVEENLELSVASVRVMSVIRQSITSNVRSDRMRSDVDLFLRLRRTIGGD